MNGPTLIRENGKEENLMVLVLSSMEMEVNMSDFS
jgi:hypothetical protein